MPDTAQSWNSGTDLHIGGERKSGVDSRCVDVPDPATAQVTASVDGTMVARMRSPGDACTAAKQNYARKSSAEGFALKRAAKAAGLKVGDGVDPTGDVGSLENAETRDRIATFVIDTGSRGARIEIAGDSPVGTGLHFPPTVPSSEPDTAGCVQEGIFGSVATIGTIIDQDGAITRADETECELVAHMWAEDMKCGLRVCERLNYGMVGPNRGLDLDSAAPFEGSRAVGPRQ